MSDYSKAQEQLTTEQSRQQKVEEEQQRLMTQRAAEEQAQREQAAKTAAAMEQQAAAFDPQTYARMVGQQAAQQQAAAARGAGASAGKAARLGNVGIGQAYTSAYGQGQAQKQAMTESAFGARSGLAGQAQSGAMGYGGLAADRARTAAGMATQQSEIEKQKADWWKPIVETTGEVAKTTGAIVSDIRAKEGIRSAPDLSETLDKIRALEYKYLPGHGSSGKHIGVAAQELEKTPLAGAVVEDGGIKKIDTEKLEVANTALIKQLYDKIKNIEEKMDAGK
jgi:hypothetical protein